MKYSGDILKWILGIALVCPLLPTQAGNSVPIFLWGGDASIELPKNATDPLRTTSQEEFEKIVSTILGGSQNPVLVFLRDNLCVEDLREHRERLKQLKDDVWWAYLPRVETPYTVFENFTSYNRTSMEDFESLSDGQMIILETKDLDSISDNFNMIKVASPNVVAVLTGKECTLGRWERSRRAIDEPSTTPAPDVSEGFSYNGTRILFWAAAAPNLTISDGKEVTANLTSGYPVQEGNGTLESPLRLNFEYTLTNGSDSSKANVFLEFPVKVAGYYSPRVYYTWGETNHTLKSKEDLSFPYNFSYHCSQTTKFGNGTFVRFVIDDVQVQIDAKDFGDAYDCVGFTSIPIWAGLFVTTILAIIMIWGLTMIMDIRTMDRFDDPKGKTITISAAE